MVLNKLARETEESRRAIEAEAKQRVGALNAEHRAELQKAQRETREWMEKYTAVFEQQTKQASELQALLLKQEYDGRDASVRAEREAQALVAARRETREAEDARAADKERYESQRCEQAAVLQRTMDKVDALQLAHSTAQRAHTAELLQLQRKHKAEMDKVTAEQRIEMGNKESVISDLRQQLADIEEVFR